MIPSTIELISLLTLIGGIITIINFSIKLSSLNREMIKNEINLQRDVNHAINNIQQLTTNLAVISKQIDVRLDDIEKNIIRLESNCRYCEYSHQNKIISDSGLKAKNSSP